MNFQTQVPSYAQGHIPAHSTSCTGVIVCLTNTHSYIQTVLGEEQQPHVRKEKESKTSEEAGINHHSPSLKQVFC